ncbi:MAG: glycosyltransferase [Chloroflexi bacterium]|nr:glycosyltransferase [Chloroflexota bacterium]MDA8189686.1 glycosyltransferase [Dehalococcoidales bacterium]
MKVAIACSWLNQYGGAERVLEYLHEMYPEAPIYTSMYWPEVMPSTYRQWDIRTSFMDKLPLVKKHHQAFLALYPLAFEQFDLNEYDVVISLSSAYCHGVITDPKTLHVSYCLTPARFLWNYHEYIKNEKVGSVIKLMLPVVLNYLRKWDVQAANRVDNFVAISKAVVRRIEKIYRRRAAIIYPPIDASSFHLNGQNEVGDYFLIISRLIPYKRIDLAVRAFSELGLPLKIVGGGRHREALEKLAKPNVEFLGRVSDADIKKLYSSCRAFVFPGVEDFGLTPLEAQASGRPVIAYAAGGALETIVEGKTGNFFREPTPESLASVVAKFDHRQFDPVVIRQHAEQFDVSVFKGQFARFVEEKWRDHLMDL